MQRKWGIFWGITAMVISFADLATAQEKLVFANQGPGFSAPFRDTYGCPLDDSWKADLVVGWSQSLESIWLVTSPTPFLNSNGCGTGFFNGGIVDVPSGLLPAYAKVRVWQGAETYAAARAAGTGLWGETRAIAVQTTGSGPEYLSSLQPSVVAGPITPWFMTEAFTADYFYGPHPVVVPAGHELLFAIVKPLLVRAPVAFRWQRLNSESNWVDIAGANTSSLRLKSVGTNDAGEYRAVFNFGCGCADQIGEAGVTIIGVDGHEGLTLVGPPGGKYQIDFKDVLGGSNDWQPLTNVVLTTGLVSRLDPAFPNSSQRFYRVVYRFQ